MTLGYTTLTIEDNGGSVVTVPTQSVQLVIGMSSAGVAYTPFSTRSQATIESNLGYGPVLEAAMGTLGGLEPDPLGLDVGFPPFDIFVSTR